jgi:hypothetical protein
VRLCSRGNAAALQNGRGNAAALQNGRGKRLASRRMRDSAE